MPLTEEDMKSINNRKEFVNNEATQCNIKGTMFGFTELVKKGQEALQGGGKADDLVKVQKIYDNTIDDIIVAFKNTCGCKGSTDLR